MCFEIYKTINEKKNTFSCKILEVEVVTVIINLHNLKSTTTKEKSQYFPQRICCLQLHRFDAYKH